MSATNACPECGARVPTDAPLGLCPRCLMNAASSETATNRPTEKPAAATTPTAVDWAEILRAIRELDVVSALDLERLASLANDDPARLARVLVQSKLLTQYQAGALLQGKARGLVIGQYLVEDKLGVGGMGVVFKARHRPSGRVVALKILPPSFGREQDAVRRFRREFQIASRLSHPNIVAAIEASEDRGVLYLTMEYIPGYDLDRLVSQGGSMALKLALHCAIQVARGLEAAHSQGVIHRDIKPGNIMIDPSGGVRVLDLGLARVIEASNKFGRSAAGSLTQTGSYMGTVDFLAPEQAEDAKSADGRADIYSLACTFFFLLTGKPPFPGDSVLKRLMAHQERPAPSLRAARPEVPEALEAIYLKMMAKRPIDRPQTVSEVVMALEACRTSSREAGDASADLKTFARTILKRAPERRQRGTDASVFARPAADPGGLEFDPDLNLEDLVGDYRGEAGHNPIAEEKLPPIISRPLPIQPHRRRRSAPYGLLGLVLIGLAGGWYAFRPGTEPAPSTPPPSAAIETRSPPYPPSPPSLASKVPITPFRPLFEGKDLTGWAGTVDDFRVLDGLLSCKPGKQAVIYEPVERTDFVARVEFRLAPGSESGLLIRYPGQGDSGYHSMCELQILDDSHASYSNIDPRHFNGSAYGLAAARRGYLKPLGEWNFEEITVRGSTIKVELNGVVILDTDLAPIRDFAGNRTHPGKDRKSGYFGIQSGIGTAQGNVQYRKIEIRDLAKTTAPPVVIAPVRNQPLLSETAAPVAPPVVIVPVRNRPLLSEDFNIPNNGWAQSSPKELARNDSGVQGIANGRWFCTSRGFDERSWNVPGGPYPEIEAEVDLRVVCEGNTDPRGGALIQFHTDLPGPSGKRASRGFQVRLDGRGILVLGPSWRTAKAYPKGPWLETIAHPALKPAGQPNLLKFRIKKRQLQIFAGEVPIGEPIVFNWDLTPTSIQVGADSWSGVVRAEFDRVEIRELATTTTAPASIAPPAASVTVRNRALLFEDFNLPNDGWPKSSPKDLARNEGGFCGFADGRLICTSRGENAWPVPGGTYPEIEAEFEVRVVGDRNVDPRGGALIQFHTDLPGQSGKKASRGFQVRIDGRGILVLEPSFWTAKAYPKGPWRETIAHPALKPAGQQNLLKFRLKKRLLEIFAGGVPVGEPIAFDWDLTPTSILVGADSWSGVVRAEFNRIEIRELPEQ